MRRALIITAAGLGALALLVAGAFVFLFHSGPGRAFIRTEIEKEIGAQLNSEAAIGALEGALPSEIIVENLVLTDAQGTWLTVEQLTVRFEPLALLWGDARVSLLSIEGARLLRTPPEGADDEDDAPQPIRLPTDLPSVSIERLEISNAVAELTGAAERLDGVGALHMKDGRIDAQARLTSAADRDTVDMTLDLDPARNRLFVDMTLAAAPGGVIAAFAGLNGPLYLEAKSDSLLDVAVISFNGEVADYGAFEATATANLEDLTAANAMLTFTPGAALGDAPELAGPIAASLRMEERQDGGALLLREVSGPLGTVTGELNWRSGGRFVDALAADLNAALAAGYRPELQQHIGASLSFNADLVRRGERYGARAALEGGGARLTLEDGETDLRRTLAANVALALPPLEGAPAFASQPIRIQSILDLALEDRLSLRGLSVEFADGSSIGGAARYSFADETLAFDGDLMATPEMIAALLPATRAADAATAEVILSGDADRLTLEANLQTPALSMGDDAVPPLIVNAALAGLPSAPTGDITARARGDAQGRFEAQLRSSVDGLINLPRLYYASGGFRLEGSGALDPGQETAQIDLAYEGGDGAAPWPGLVLAGDFQAQGVLSRDGALNNLTATAARLAINDIAVAALSLNVEGPPGSSSVTAQSDALYLPGGDIVDDFSATAIVDAQDDVSITLTALEGVVGGDEARLAEAAVIRFGDATEIENLRLSYGGEGSIAFDGAVSPTRWRAQAALDAINIPDADGRISLNLDLDTDRPTPARGDFMLQSLLMRDRQAALGGAFVWDGERLTVTNEEDADAVDMRFVLPARLSKTPSLSVDTQGPLEGYARYEGDAHVIAAYLPPELQTLEGALSVNFTLGGDTEAPALSGVAAIEDGQYTELRSGFALAGLDVEAEAAYSEAGSVVTFSGGARGAGQSGDDTITLTGALTLAETSALDLAVALDNAEVSARPVNTVRVNGGVDIAGPLDALQATGEISVEELDAEIITPESTGLVDIEVVGKETVDRESRAPGAPAPEPAAAPSALDFNIRVTADDRIFIRGRGLESEWSAGITASNTRSGALIVGDMTLRRGWLDFSGRRFDLTRGVITFDRLSPNNPVLDIRAEYAANGGVTAVIAISGRADAPSIDLLSTPSLPSEDVMALVLFGKPAEELSALESLQIAEALASLGGIGPFGGEGVAGRLRQTFGLDLLNIDIDPENGGGALTVGKYVTDGVFVSATQDAQGRNGSVRVEYEVTDNITVETELEQNGDQTVSANWKRDF